VANPLSEIECKISLSGKELEHIILTTGGQHFIPIIQGMQLTTARSFVTDLLSKSEIEFRLSRHASGGWNSQYPSHALFDGETNRTGARLDVRADHQGFDVDVIGSGDAVMHCPPSLETAFSNQFMAFEQKG